MTTQFKDIKKRLLEIFKMSHCRYCPNIGFPNTLLGEKCNDDAEQGVDDVIKFLESSLLKVKKEAYEEGVKDGEAIENVEVESYGKGYRKARKETIEEVKKLSGQCFHSEFCFTKRKVNKK